VWELLSRLDVAIGLGTVSLSLFTWLGMKLRRAMTMLRTVYQQVTPNGGSSIADHIRYLIDSQSAWRRAGIDTDPQAAWECSTDGSLMWANTACCDLFGLSLAEMTGKGWINGIYPEDRDAMMSAWMHAVRDERSFDWRYRLQCPETGAITHVRGRGRPVWAGHKLDGFSGGVWVERREDVPSRVGA